MNWRGSMLLCALASGLGGLAGCAAGGAGLGSLVAEGLQAIAGDSPAPTAQSGPFRIPDNSKAMDEINDLARRAVSQACTAELDSASAAADGGDASQPDAAASQAASDEPEPRCGYRNICLPGTARPVRMLICRNDTSGPAVAQRAER